MSVDHSFGGLGASPGGSLSWRIGPLPRIREHQLRDARSRGVREVKPASVLEAIMWASAAVALICAGVIGVVQENAAGAVASFMVAMGALGFSGVERHRVKSENDRKSAVSEQRS